MAHVARTLDFNADPLLARSSSVVRIAHEDARAESAVYGAGPTESAQAPRFALVASSTCYR